MFLVSACSFKNQIDSSYYCQKLKLNCTKDNKIINFKTSKGNFEVKLFGKDNPVTVSNFINNINKNIYKNQKFYKIINYPQVKVIHAGINEKNNYLSDKNQILNKQVLTIPLEINLKKMQEPKYEYQIKTPSSNENVKNLFERGSIAMVKIGERDSSSTEFFFVTNKMPELDGRYSIFGKIASGFEVLEEIDNRDIIYDIKISD